MSLRRRAMTGFARWRGVGQKSTRAHLVMQAVALKYVGSREYSDIMLKRTIRNVGESSANYI